MLNSTPSANTRREFLVRSAATAAGAFLSDSPLESVENFAIYGLAYTVNSGSIPTEFDRLSRAGAARLRFGSP